MSETRLLIVALNMCFVIQACVKNRRQPCIAKRFETLFGSIIKK